MYVHIYETYIYICLYVCMLQYVYTCKQAGTQAADMLQLQIQIPILYGDTDQMQMEAQADANADTEADADTGTAAI